MTDLLVDEDNIKSDSVQVKSVNYKEMSLKIAWATHWQSYPSLKIFTKNTE